MQNCNINKNFQKKTLLNQLFLKWKYSESSYDNCTVFSDIHDNYIYLYIFS